MRIQQLWSRQKIRVGVLAALVVMTVTAVAGHTRVAAQTPEPQAPDERTRRHRSVRASILGDLGGSHLGVSVRDVEDAGDQDGTAQGAVVASVRDGSPTATAGLEAGDVFVEFDGERVRSARQLSRLVQETPVGRSVSATVLRDGDRHELEVTPEEGRGVMAAVAAPLREIERIGRDFRFRVPDDLRGPYIIPRPGRLGIEVDDLGSQLADYFGVEDGVLVTVVHEDSVADQAGLQAGDVITAVDGRPVDDVNALRRRLAGVEPGEEFQITVMRDRSELSLAARFEESPTGPRGWGRAL